MASEVGFFALLLISVIGLDRPAETASLTEESLAKSINKFGCTLLNGLYSTLSAEDNLLVSLANVYAALALLHLGATGKTRQELSNVMKVPKSVKNYTQVHEQLHAILSHISPPETKLANGIFLQKDFPIKTTYVNSVKKYYDGLAQNLDFIGQSQTATDTINKWISDCTQGRIDKFFDKPLSDDTVAVLVSALYFSAKWETPFSSQNTKLEKFNTGTKEIETPMMNMENQRMYYSSDEALHYDSVCLPYAGGKYEMNIYLQRTDQGDHGSLAHLFCTLAKQNFAPTTTETKYRPVNLKLPQMKFSWKDSVVSALKLQNTFSKPHLDELTPNKNVKVSNMMHATEMQVDEKGTTASAATASEVHSTAVLAPPKESPVNFFVNCPFLVTITVGENNGSTGTILFAGIIRRPK